ncbi:MAG TPA: energy-coupling factor ABC transporter ATP-binding protein [Methanoculleus sp.]|nr:energy-coupling factor ABC transporter ATP-binding protein [Methanoculleus sp.]
MIRIAELRHRLLDIPDLALDARHIAVIGPNGSGKTTLLAVSAGIEEPDAGTVRLLCRPPSAVKVGWVGEFPDQTLLFSRVYDEIASTPRFRHRPCSETDGMVRAAAEVVDILHLLDRKVSSLSGGEKALVALAAACVDNPEVLVLDEADSHLDAGTAERVSRVVQESKAAHILWCTQSMDTAATADYVLFMTNGRVRYHGTPEKVFYALKETCFYPTMWRVCR